MKSGIEPKLGPARLGWVRLLSCVAMGLSAYLLWGSLSGDTLPGCGAASGCGTVMHSRWARLFGIPVSLPALLLYLLVLIVSGQVGAGRDPVRARLGWGMLTASATALIAAALWFIALQLWVVEAICPFCMAAHTCGLIVGVALLRAAPRTQLTPAAASAAASPSRLGNGLSGWAAAGVVAVAALAAGQIAYQPPTYAVQAIAAATIDSGSNRAQLAAVPAPSHPASNASALAVAPSTQTVSAATSPVPAPPPQPRTLKLHGGAFALNLAEVPLVGSPQAPYVIVQLFDYSCRHCRQMHPILLDAVQALSNQLAIVCLPMPLATNCNRLIKQVLPDHVNACAYAKAGLALWRADRTQLPALDEWAFDPTNRFSPKVFERKVIELVGSNAYAKATHDSWVQEQLDLDIRIFETNWVHYRKSALPQLLIGTNIVSGILRSTNDLYRLLSAQFPIRLPEGVTVAK